MMRQVIVKTLVIGSLLAFIPVLSGCSSEETGPVVEDPGPAEGDGGGAAEGAGEDTGGGGNTAE